MKTNCPRCGNWTVGNANYCHTCAWPLNPALAGGPAPGGVFELATAGAGTNGTVPIRGAILSLDWKNRATLALVGSLGATVGVMAANWEPALIPFAALATGTADIAINSLERLFWKAPKEEPEPERMVIAFEHVERDVSGRLRQLGFHEFPPGIDLEQIQHIARKCLDPPLGEGRPFSRRGTKAIGLLSQQQFEAIRDTWLDANYAFWRNEAAPNLGIVLTERCRRMLAKSLKI